MTDLRSSMPNQLDASLITCSQCEGSVNPALRGDNVPVHHPVSGDLICRGCTQNTISQSKEGKDNRPLLSDEVVALPPDMMKNSRADASETDPLTRTSAEDTVTAIFDALFYQDRSHQPITHKTLQFINNAKADLDEVNALLIEGVLNYCYERKPNSHLLMAEAKGCHYPILYHLIGRCYHFEDYFTKAIACMSLASSAPIQCAVQEGIG